tara:strand:- start:42 stop:347 length:306 start_codon:yes stop_codon:yes gene_type:complete
MYFKYGSKTGQGQEEERKSVLQKKGKISQWGSYSKRQEGIQFTYRIASQGSAAGWWGAQALFLRTDEGSQGPNEEAEREAHKKGSCFEEMEMLTCLMFDFY